MGELDREALAFGLVTTTGTVSRYRRAGLTLAGGVGRLSRSFGLAIDNLLAIGHRHRGWEAASRPAPEEKRRSVLGEFAAAAAISACASAFEYRLRPLKREVLGGGME